MQTDSNSLFSIERKRVANFQAYAKASLPAAGSAGRIVRVTDSVRSLWMDSGTQFFGLNGETVNVREFNATGDGATDDRSAINTAATAAAAVANGAGLVFPSGTYKISSNLTLSANVVLQMLPGAKITVDTGITLTIAGPVDADPMQHIFTGLGNVAFTSVGHGAGTWAGTVYPEWYGAVGDFVVDCKTPISRALNSGAGHVQMNSGLYGISAAIEITTNSNFVWEGDANTSSVILPLNASMGATNAMFIIKHNALNAIISRIRFLNASTAFTGFIFWAREDVVAGTHALFSTRFLECWFSPGTLASGAFHGDLIDSFVIGCTFEFCATAWDFDGPYFAGNVFADNIIQSDTAYFIRSLGGSGVNNVVDTLCTNHRALALFYLEDADNFHISGLSLEFNGLSGDSPPVALAGGIAEFVDCTNCSIDDFEAHSLAGYMSGITCTSSDVRISNGHIYDAESNAAVPGIITITGTASEVDVTNVKIFDSLTHDFRVEGSGNVQLNYCHSIRSEGYGVYTSTASSVNLEVSNCRFVNSSYNAGGGSVGMALTNSSGRTWYTDNAFIVDSGSSTPTGVFAHIGSGDFYVGGNRFAVGSVPLSVSGSATQLMKLGPNHGLVNVYFASGMPSTGSWKVGDKVLLTVVAEAGGAGSKYVIHGYDRATTGSGNVLNTDWFQMRTLTGN